jgi:hypothetical protein
MDLLKDVTNRLTIPTDLGEKFIYHLEQLVAAALTQTYKYIVKNSFEYNKLITRKAYVFLYIIESELYMLYYYLAEPNAKAKAQNKVDILLCCTVIEKVH